MSNVSDLCYFNSSTPDLNFNANHPRGLVILYITTLFLLASTFSPVFLWLALGWLVLACALFLAGRVGRQPSPVGRRSILAFFTLPFTQTVIAQQQLKVLVYDIEQEVIVKWLE